MKAAIYPRRALPGRVLLVTRRTHERRFRMVPKQKVRRVQRYILTRAARETGVRLHAFTFLSNHYHIVLTDNPRRSAVSRFLARLNRHLSRVLNRLFQTRGYLWDSEPPHIVELLDREAVLLAIVYTLTNAQRAGLASKTGGWIGVESGVAAIGSGPQDVARPIELGATSRLPESIELELTKPRFFEDLDAPEFRALLERRLSEASRRIRLDRARLGRRTKSPAAILSTRIHSAPKETAREEAERRARDARNRTQFRGSRERCEAAEAALIGFQEAYRQAFRRWQKGDRSVLFPVGTDVLRRLHRVKIARAA